MFCCPCMLIVHFAESLWLFSEPIDVANHVMRYNSKCQNCIKLKMLALKIWSRTVIRTSMVIWLILAEHEIKHHHNLNSKTSLSVLGKRKKGNIILILVDIKSLQSAQKLLMVFHLNAYPLTVYQFQICWQTHDNLSL